jgi:CubicO group peptidase (beta-lactamase class C family)
MVDNNFKKIDWMKGFPPAADKIIRYADRSFYEWPQLRWSFNHIEELMPTKNVWRGSGASTEIPYQLQDFSDLEIKTDQGTLGWGEMLNSSFTDGLIVLHQGKIVFEDYFCESGPLTRHLIQSCNKSFVGTIAETLIHEGRLDPEALVPSIIPELENTAWGDATVRQVMDMLIGMEFHEDYADPKSEIWRFLRATAMSPPKPGDKSECIADVLPRIKKEGSHGQAFAYREPNIFVLGWIVRRIGNEDLATQVSNRIWQHLGAEQDAYYMIDSIGAETSCGLTLRDFVRFGAMIGNNGRVGDKQVIPVEVVDRIMAGGDPALFAKAGFVALEGWSYQSQWWVRHIAGRNCAVARGAHGQLLYIDPTNELVIARFGTTQQPGSSLLDCVMWPMVDTITEMLSQEN